jgi:Tfp pilus assembly protein PilX
VSALQTAPPIRSMHRGAHGLAQRGAALAVALILLVILTLLAVSGMSLATAELAMAGNEQLRRRAADAASSGIERAIERMSTLPGVPSEMRFDDVTLRYVGNETSLPGFSAEKFVGRHYVIESIGSAPRGARDVQRQGVLVIGASAGIVEFAGRGS